jgi:hypothetical protein
MKCDKEIVEYVRKVLWGKVEQDLGSQELGVYYFPVTAVTNCHKDNGLKQHVCVQFEYQKSYQGISRATIPLEVLESRNLFLALYSCLLLLLLIFVS